MANTNSPHGGGDPAHRPHDENPATSRGRETGAGIGRRRFVAGSLAAAAAFGGLPGRSRQAQAAVSPTPGRRLAAGRRVAVFGGGMGGLTVAHELAERGFEVTVYERKALGGKCRSFPNPGTGSGGRQDLPAEHGFRFFPGFYQNLPDTMSRIPLSGGGNAKGNLVAGDEEVAFYRGHKIVLPASGSIAGALSPDSLLKFLQTAASVFTTVPANEVAFFLQKMIVFTTSGPKRRLGQWEKMSFADYVQSAKMSQQYRDLLVDMFTSTLVAAKPDKANARTMGLMAESWVYSTLGLGGYSAPDRVLNAPTNQALIDPWVAYLRGLGVGFQVGSTLTGLSVTDGRISGATVADAGGGTSPVDADYYVLAVPVERAVPVLNDRILAIDPGLKALAGLTTDWMNGVMLYLTRPLSLSKGHVTYPPQPWALTSVNQAQFWKGTFADTYGDGSVADCLSIDLSAWDKPGILYGKTAKECTPDQIIDEVKAQLRTSLGGTSKLPDSVIHSSFIDPAITGVGTAQVADDEPLLINTPDSWARRPEAATALPNLFLAADYVRSSINLATMEGANEAGRKAANAVLAASGSSAKPATLFTLYQPREFASLYDSDDFRYAAGLPNAFDVIAPYWPGR